MTAYHLAAHGYHHLMLYRESTPEPHIRVELQHQPDLRRWQYELVAVLFDTRHNNHGATLADYGARTHGTGVQHDPCVALSKLHEVLASGCHR